MSWVRSILDIYWELRPFYETQNLYKSHKLRAFDYWKYELEYLTQSTWKKDDEFMSLNGIEYLINKYPGEKIKLDHTDRIELGRHFLLDLGISQTNFPCKIY
jgi:hypothetical protein